VNNVKKIEDFYNLYVNNSLRKNIKTRCVCFVFKHLCFVSLEMLREMIWVLGCSIEICPSVGDQGLAAPETRNLMASCH